VQTLKGRKCALVCPRLVNEFVNALWPLHTCEYRSGLWHNQFSGNCEILFPTQAGSDHTFVLAGEFRHELVKQRVDVLSVTFQPRLE